MSFYLIRVIRILVRCAIPHSHWLIYHVFLFPKWIGTQNAAHTHTCSLVGTFGECVACDFRLLPTLITANSHVPSERICTLSSGCVRLRQNAAQTTTIHLFLRFAFCDLNLNRLFIRIYYFHSFVSQHNHHRHLLHCCCCSCQHTGERTVSKYRIEKKQIENKMGKQFPDRQTHFLHFVSME